MFRISYRTVCSSKHDVIKHLKRNFSKKKLIILGTGWAGFRLLKDVDTSLYDVTVVSPRNHFLFTPLLTSTTVGTLEFRGVTEDIRTAKPHSTFVQAYATSIDPEKKMLYAESAYEVREKDEDKPERPVMEMKYDDLVITVGAFTNTFGVPGVEKYCFFLKQLSDARAIRQRIIECFERASSPVTSLQEKQRLLHFMIVGGGPTSVEFAAELHDFLKQDVHKVYPDLENLVHITLVEAGKKLLGSFQEKLSDYTMKLFKTRKIDVRVNTSVKEVRRHEMELSDGTVIPFGMGVWSTGLAPSTFVKSLPFEKDKSGRIIVDDHFRVLNQSNIYAGGDCATFPKNPLAPTAQAAEQVGKYLANEFNSAAKGTALSPFVYQHRGMLAYIGGKQALIDTPLSKSGGFLSWIAWNAAYITKLVSVKNKIMIPMYWFKSFMFGRDITRF